MTDPSTATWAAALATTVGALVLIGQLILARRQSAQLEITILQDVADTWSRLQPDWHRLLLADEWRGHGALVPRPLFDDHRSDLERRVELIRVLEKEPASKAGFERSEEWRAASAELNQLRARLTAEFGPSVQEILRFIGLLASLIFRRRLTTIMAYEVSGIEINQHAGAIRRVMNGPPVKYWLDDTPGLRDRVLTFIDLMYAESVRNGDASSRRRLALARHKAETGSGVRNRQRTWLLASTIGGRRSARELESLLLCAEIPPDLGWFKSTWLSVKLRLTRDRKTTREQLAAALSEPHGQEE